MAVLPFPSITRAAMLVAIPAYAMFGWQAHTTAGSARRPAPRPGSRPSIMTRSTPGSASSATAWRPASRSRRRSSGATSTRASRPARGWSAGRATPAPAEHGDPASPARTFARSRPSPARADRERARSVAATASGDVFVADGNGRVEPPRPERNVAGAAPAAHAAAGADLRPGRRCRRRRSTSRTPSARCWSSCGRPASCSRPSARTGGCTARVGWRSVRTGGSYVADTGRNRIAVGTPDGRLPEGDRAASLVRRVRAADRGRG